MLGLTALQLLLATTHSVVKGSPVQDACSAKLNADCAPWLSPTVCGACARKHASDLKAAGCTTVEVEALCKGSSSGRSIQKVLLSGDAVENGGRCLDGSPSGFYFQAAAKLAPPPLSTTWVIDLQGGGDCADEDSCIQRSKTSLGSSNYWPATASCTFCDPSPITNPDFALANSVYIPYCSGDVHGGQRTTATNSTFNLYFSGHLNVVRIMDLLLDKFGIANATHVLVTGTSAGGIGTFLNVDYIQTRLPNASVKGAPNAGWFFPSDPEGLPTGSGFPQDFADFAAKQPSVWDNSSDVLWAGYTLPACAVGMLAAGKPPWFCGSISNLYPYIKAPLLVVENQYDTNQIFTQLGTPKDPKDPQNASLAHAFIARYGELMRNATAQIASHRASGANTGIFLPSCLDHGVSNSTKIRGVSYMELVGDWFWDRNTIDPIVIDDCTMKDGMPCNPTCQDL